MQNYSTRVFLPRLALGNYRLESLGLMVQASSSPSGSRTLETMLQLRLSTIRLPKKPLLKVVKTALKVSENKNNRDL